MLRWIYLLRNLTRNPLRAILTCAAVWFPITICVLSVAVINGFDRYFDNAAQQLRLAVTNKASIINPLPAGHRPKIEALDPDGNELLSVCAFQWIGGTVEGMSQPLSTLAVDADTFVTTFSEYQFTPEEIAAWKRDRLAVVVGRATAKQFGWKVGDRITITASVPPYSEIELHVVSTAPKAVDTITIFCRRDYVSELLALPSGQEYIHGFWVRCATPEALARMRDKIDATFAGSNDETKTVDEKSFMNEWVLQMFNLPRNLTIFASITVFVAVMAAANTMSMNFRDRLNEFASLKALGFRSRSLFGVIQTESMFLCLIGGTLGALGPYVAFMHTKLREYPIPLIQTLEIEPIVCVYGLLISIGVGIVAAAWPTVQLARLNVVTALRNLE